MGFTCEGCHKHIQGPAGKGKQIPQNRVVVETRQVKYVHQYKDKEGKKRTSTGQGSQIVREKALCPKCFQSYKTALGEALIAIYNHDNP
jgi:hypothetical protein